MKEKTLQYFETVKKIYADARPNSLRLHQAACKYLPGGDTRTATFFLPFPNFIQRGEGAYMYDEDGFRLLDFQNNYTSLIHGHAHAQTVEAVREQIGKGSAYTAPFEKQIELSAHRPDSLHKFRHGSEYARAADRQSLYRKGKDHQNRGRLPWDDRCI